MTISISRRNAVAALGCLAAGLSAPHVARAALRVVRFGHNNTLESHYGRGSDAYASAAASHPELAGVLKVEVHANAELGDELGMLKNCAAGTLDGMICSNSVFGNLVPEVGLLNAPFLFADVGHARAALDGALGSEFSAVAAKKDVRVLAWTENGIRHMTANKPIRQPVDVQGLRIRVPQSEVMIGGLRALGADAAPLSYNLLRDALRSGQFQAQENPIVNIEAAKLYEMQKYVSLTGHIYDAAVVLASADLMEDLTPAQQAALADCARKGGAVMRQVAERAQLDGIGRLRAAGMTVVEDVDVAAFRTAARPYLESLSAKFGAERVKRVMEAGA